MIPSLVSPNQISTPNQTLTRSRKIVLLFIYVCDADNLQFTTHHLALLVVRQQPIAHRYLHA